MSLPPISAKRSLSLFVKTAFSLPDALYAFFIVFPCFFFLAEEPQNPDGAELVNVITHGGVPHPPGFPLLLSLGRLVTAFKLTTPTLGLGLLSLFFLCLALMIYLQTLKKLGCPLGVRLFSGVILAYYPTLNALALQPEKYTLIIFVIFMFLHSGMRLFQEKSKVNLSLFGLSLGIGFAHHDSSVGFIPPALILCFFLAKDKNLTVREALYGLIPAALLPLLAYPCLLIFRQGPAWVNWGELNDPTDLISFVFNKNFGHAKDLWQQPILERVNISVARDFVLQLFDSFSISIYLIFFVGLYELYRHHKKFLSFLIGLTTSFFMITLLVPPARTLSEMGYSERYTLLMFPPLAVICALGIKFLSQNAKSWHKKIFILSGVLFCLYYLKMAHSVNGSMNHHLLKVYRESVAAELTKESFFVTGNDWLTFDSVVVEGRPRYAIVNLFPLDWYRYSVAPRIDQRITEIFSKLNHRGAWNFYDLIRTAFDEGYEVVSSEFDLVKHLAPHIQRRGVVWKAHKSYRGGIWSEESTQSAWSLCQKLKEIRYAIPPMGNYFQRDLLEIYRKVYWHMGMTLDRAGDKVRAEKARLLGDALGPGSSPTKWPSLCTELFRPK